MAKKATPMSSTPFKAGANDPAFFMSGEVTPTIANAAAMRVYTRNAPYLGETLSDPQRIREEIYKLASSGASDDPETEYRIRLLQQALQDIYNMSANSTREFLPGPTTPRSPPTMPSNMGGRAR